MDLVNVPVNCLLMWRGKVPFCTTEVSISLTEFIETLCRLLFKLLFKLNIVIAQSRSCLSVLHVFMACKHLYDM